MAGLVAGDELKRRASKLGVSGHPLRSAFVKDGKVRTDGGKRIAAESTTALYEN